MSKLDFDNLLFKVDKEIDELLKQVEQKKNARELLYQAKLNYESQANGLNTGFTGKKLKLPDAIEKVLLRVDSPRHVDWITNAVQTQEGVTANKQAVSSTLTRYHHSGKKFIRTGKNEYDLINRAKNEYDGDKE